jgi:crotonobetainyl-CoA:carnitine CoA-transferase CaiB-like acyl-CoA transferase
LSRWKGTLSAQLAEGFAAISKDDGVDRLLAKGVPAAPVTETVDIFDNPWMHENGYFEDFDHPQFGAMMGPKHLGRFGRSGGGYPRRSPLIGEHSVEVLRDYGFEEERIAELVAAGVVRQG